MDQTPPFPGDTDLALFDQRRDALLARLPARLGRSVAWLLTPRRRWLRIPAGLLLLLGGLLSFLPVLGVWMLPLGMLLLAEDIAPMRHLAARSLGWIARRHPQWLGQNGSRPTPSPPSAR